MDTIETLETQEPLKPKIPFYVRRTFGEKMSACFDFIKENFKPLLKYCTYLILPLALIQSLSMNSFMNVYFGMVFMDDYSSFSSLDGALWGIIGNYFFLILCSMAGSVMLCSMVYTLMQLYNSREQRLRNITFAEIKPTLMRNIKRMVLVMLFFLALGFAMIIALVLLAVLTPFTLALTIPGILVCFIPLTLMTPIYLFEDISIMNAFTKAFKTGFATWGGIFAVAFVTGMIGSVIQGATTTPWYVATFVRFIFAASEGNAAIMDASIIEKFIIYLLGVIQVYGAYISMIIGVIGIGYQYSHSSDLMDNTSIVSEIDKFEQL